MNQVRVKIIDQYNQEYIVPAFLNKTNDESVSFFNKIDRIVVNDEIILPNVDLLYGSHENGKIFKVLGIVE